MKIWIKFGDGWPWTAEKFRYSIEQMLITLFPSEKFEFLDWPLGKDYPGVGELLIHFIEGSSFAIGASTDLGPDRREGPDPNDEDDYQHWQDLYQGGFFGFVHSIPLEKLDGTDEDYHIVSHVLKQTIYRIGIKMLTFSGEKEPDYKLPWGCLTGVRPVKLPTRAMLAGKTPEEAEQELRREYLVDGERAALAVECAQAALAVHHTLTSDRMALYIGIPFCPTRCAYCSFISSDVKGSLALVEPYVDGLCREIEFAGKALRERGLSISCAYMGGGTPTTLSAEQLHRVLSAVETYLPMERCGEFTVEAGRPDTITAEKLAVLKAHGIHRISINPQTMEDGVLRAIGRAHTAAQIDEAMALAQAHFGGLVNMDLIAGLPTDTLDGFERTLDRVLAMEPANITVHTLALKKGSRLIEANLVEAGGALCAPEVVEAMLALAWSRLRAAGYAPYYLYRQKYMSGSFENVGWARPGAVCAYNIVMMEELQTVLSLGAGGITKLVDYENRKIVRLNNPKYAKEYLESWDKVSSAKRAAAEFQAELNEKTRPWC